MRVAAMRSALRQGAYGCFFFRVIVFVQKVLLLFRERAAASSGVAEGRGVDALGLRRKSAGAFAGKWPRFCGKATALLPESVRTSVRPLRGPSAAVPAPWRHVSAVSVGERLPGQGQPPYASPQSRGDF